MGSSSYHDFMYETLLRYPGIVTLHDFHLAAYHLYRGAKQGRQRQYFRQELLQSYPQQAKEVLAALKSLLTMGTWCPDERGLIRECGRRGWFLNQRIIDTADRLIVHSPWCLEQARAVSHSRAARTVVVPQGAPMREATPAERAQIRARFGFSADALVVAAFGLVTPEKMVCEALDAFQAVPSADGAAVFVVAGEEIDRGQARRHAAKLGLGPRVRFLGRQLDKDFRDLMAVTDVGVGLRRPPTNGETSAALLHLLGSGVATIVTDVATFSDYPDAAVCKVRWESEGPAGLRRAMLELAGDPRRREMMGRAAFDCVHQRHAWPTVARLYVEVIEDCHVRRLRCGTN